MARGVGDFGEVGRRGGSLHFGDPIVVEREGEMVAATEGSVQCPMASSLWDVPRTGGDDSVEA